MYCGKCGHKSKTGSAFCDRCGFKLGADGVAGRPAVRRNNRIIIFASACLIALAFFSNSRDGSRETAPPENPAITADNTASDTANESHEPSAHTQDETSPFNIYFEFFAMHFDIVDYTSMHGPWALWGHTTQGSLRLTKQVAINRIDGFDHPILVLSEFETIEENGEIIVPGQSYLNAYLIKDGGLSSDLNRAEFDAIFSPIDDYGWNARYNGEDMGRADINGENLFFMDFSGDVKTDNSMDALLSRLMRMN